MISLAELPTLTDVERAQHFLAVAAEVSPTTDATYLVDRKRRALIVCTPREETAKRLYFVNASELHVHAAFRRRYKSALQTVEDFEQSPAPFLLATEQTSQEHNFDLAERIAIMLDSCTPVQLTDLTTTFGKDALGGYAHIFGQPISR